MITMIEKLKTIDPYDETEIDMEANSVAGLVYENTPLVQKINELVDAVNVLQAQVAILQEHAHLTATTEPVDPYAEQRKWIGKLCKFWDNDDTQQLSYGVLTNIDTELAFCGRYRCNDENHYDNCQPVKQDDNIIYKGEKDENN